MWVAVLLRSLVAVLLRSLVAVLLRSLIAISQLSASTRASTSDQVDATRGGGPRRCLSAYTRPAMSLHTQTKPSCTSRAYELCNSSPELHNAPVRFAHV